MIASDFLDLTTKCPSDYIAHLNSGRLIQPTTLRYDDSVDDGFSRISRRRNQGITMPTLMVCGGRPIQTSPRSRPGPRIARSRYLWGRRTILHVGA